MVHTSLKRFRIDQQIDDIRTEMVVTVEKASAKITEMKSASVRREQDLVDRCSKLKENIIHLQVS